MYYSENGGFANDTCSRKRGRPRKEPNSNVLEPCISTWSMEESHLQSMNQGPGLPLMFVPKKPRTMCKYPFTPRDDQCQVVEFPTSPEDASTCRSNLSDSWKSLPLSAFYIPGPIPDFTELSDEILVNHLKDLL